MGATRGQVEVWTSVVLWTSERSHFDGWLFNERFIGGPEHAFMDFKATWLLITGFHDIYLIPRPQEIKSFTACWLHHCVVVYSIEEQEPTAFSCARVHTVVCFLHWNGLIGNCQGLIASKAHRYTARNDIKNDGMENVSRWGETMALMCCSSVALTSTTRMSWNLHQCSSLQAFPKVNRNT